jgi:regulator of protease activity HflC (stomatin/prohibitin superfamily)
MTRRTTHSEKTFAPFSAWPIVITHLALLVLTIALAAPTKGLVLLVTFLPLVLLAPGYFIVVPNTSRVLVLFGRYRGSARTEGFYWTNPFTTKRRVSLRAHNFNSERLKVNDLAGNPIEIAAVVVWQVRDTARAVFDVEDFGDFVSVQSEAAVRQLASRHPYDEGQSDVVKTTLRGSADEVAAELMEALQARLDQAGIEVVEARLSYLAYAQEIASAMLQRQQATAIIAARQKIVEGAVGMVESALEQIEKGGMLHLDDERKATLVGNLLVVLCAHENPQPVLNTGSLYT